MRFINLLRNLLRSDCILLFLFAYIKIINVVTSTVLDDFVLL